MSTESLRARLEKAKSWPVEDFGPITKTEVRLALDVIEATKVLVDKIAGSVADDEVGDVMGALDAFEAAP